MSALRKLSRKDVHSVQAYLYEIQTYLRKNDLEFDLDSKLNELCAELVTITEDNKVTVKCCRHEENCGSISSHVELLLDEMLGSA